MPGRFYYGFDMYYLILVVPAIILALWAQIKVKSTYAKYSKIPNLRNITGAAAAQEVLRANNVLGVRIERIQGNLTDNFDPRTNVIHLSEGVFDSTSVAAVGIAAHEAGHAVQHAQEYAPIKLRSAIIPATKIGSTLALPLVIIGLIANISILMYAGIVLFSLAVLFQVITLPVEFNASRRALEAITQSNLLPGDEARGAKKVLTAAAMTYVAALAVSLMQLLRLILISRSRD